MARSALDSWPSLEPTSSQKRLVVMVRRVSIASIRYRGQIKVFGIDVGVLLVLRLETEISIQD